VERFKLLALRATARKHSLPGRLVRVAAERKKARGGVRPPKAAAPQLCGGTV